MTATGLAPVRTRLDNGAVIITKQSRVTPAVTVYAAVAAGSAFDPPAQAGLAHFVSKTIDRGTGSRSAEQIAEALDSRGVSLTTSVNRHTLSLVCTCLEEDLEAVLALVADILMHPTFPADEVATRRGEIVTLIRQDEDSPAAMAGEGLMTLLYGTDHPYGRRLRGTVESVESIDRDALVGFHQARFTPAALTLVLVGDVEPGRAVAAATAAFAAWPPAAAAAPVFPPIPASAARRVQLMPMMNKAQADIAYGFTAIERSDPAYYAYWLMNNILGQYAIGGRLGDSIRETQGMAYYVFSGLDANVIPGPFIVRAGVNPANVERAVASIDAELERMAAEGPTDRELAESRQYLVGSMPRNLETNAGIATFLQMVEAFGLGLDYDLRVPGLLGAVTRDEVLAAARALLMPSRAAVVVAGPYAGPLA